MATTQSRTLAKAMLFPSVILLLAWMIVPLCMTLYFSFLDYNLLTPGNEEFVGFLNYEFFLTDPAFVESFFNTLLLVGGVLLITICGGIVELRLRIECDNESRFFLAATNKNRVVRGKFEACDEVNLRG